MQPHIFGSDEPLFTCPLTYFRDNPEMEAKALGLHLHWKRGILPSPGALDDQAAHYAVVITATDIGVTAGQNRLQEIAMRKAGGDTGKRGGGKKKRHTRKKR